MNERSRLLRAALVRRLIASGTIRSVPVAEAILKTPRELFLRLTEHPLSLLEVYRDTSIGIKRGLDGYFLSACSFPTVQAQLLNALRLKPGMRILDIGTGSGYTASLIGHMVGESGEVLSVDIEPSLVEAANVCFSTLEQRHVQAVVGDGAVSQGSGKRFDRIVITCHQSELLPLWAEQLKPGGLLIVPLTIGYFTHGAPIVVLKAEDGRLRAIETFPGSFLCAQGTQGHAPSFEDNLFPIIDQEGVILGHLRSRTKITTFSGPLLSSHFRPSGQLQPFYRPLNNMELSGLALYFQLSLPELTLLYSEAAALGFRGLAFANRFPQAEGSLFVNRRGVICYGTPPEGYGAFETALNWARAGCPDVARFYFDAFPTGQAISRTYDFVLKKRFYTLGVRILPFE